jgi:glutamate dehydrogenase
MESVIKQQLRATQIESQVQLVGFRAGARAHDHPRADRQPDTCRCRCARGLIAETVRTWNDRLRAALIEARGELEGRTLADRFANAFPAAYEEDVAIPVVLEDIKQLQEVIANPDRIAMRLAADPTAAAESIHLRLFRSASPITLSQALPILENMGFVVLSEHPYRIEVPGSRPIWLQDFQMQRRDGGTVSPQALGPRFTRRSQQSGTGAPRTTASTGSSSMTADDLAPGSSVRAYCKFLLQTGGTFSQSYMEQVLASNSAIASALSQLFEAQFDPAMKAPRRETELTRVQAEIDRLLDAVTSLDEDRILRRFVGAIRATLRTNYYQKMARSRSRAGCRSSSTRATCPSCRSRGRRSRSSSTRRASKACTCAWDTSRAAASAGQTGARTSAPKCSA